MSAGELPPYPSGWFAVAFSDELAPGAVLSRRLAGEDVVLFRTASGRACATGAYCPHLGAHLGHCGSVEGELLRCGFHGFCFDADGSCVKTGYGTPPPKARLDLVPVREKHGIILAWHHPHAAPPAWEIPDLSFDGWTPLYHRSVELDAHPQETTENSVDLGHFTHVHGYDGVEMTSELVAEGPYLSTAFRVQRHLPVLDGFDRARRSQFAYQTHIHGLGYSLVHVEAPRFGLDARLWVLARPLAPGRMALAIACRTRIVPSRKVHPALGLVPSRWIATAAARGLLAGLAQDAGQDFRIWEHKRYVATPALARGDGPIMRYRRWARQFYAEFADDAAGVESVVDRQAERAAR